MTDIRKAAEQALEALENPWKAGAEGVADAIIALRQALAQEWVCCVCGDPKALGIVHRADAPCFHYTKRNCDNCESLRKAAWDRINELEAKLAEREWVGLTEEEAAACWHAQSYVTWRNIEAKLKEKNYEMPTKT